MCALLAVTAEDQGVDHVRKSFWKAAGRTSRQDPGCRAFSRANLRGDHRRRREAPMGGDRCRAPSPAPGSRARAIGQEQQCSRERQRARSAVRRQHCREHVSIEIQGFDTRSRLMRSETSDISFRLERNPLSHLDREALTHHSVSERPSITSQKSAALPMASQCSDRILCILKGAIRDAGQPVGVSSYVPQTIRCWINRSRNRPDRLANTLDTITKGSRISPITQIHIMFSGS